MEKQAIRTPMQLAMVLSGYRKKLKLTQKQAGENVGLFPKTISALENSPDDSSIASLFKLLSALGLELVLKPKSIGRNGGEW
ncbi:MAG: helix-turn-helix domain-containing protein [Chlorobiaceae bacterium]